MRLHVKETLYLTSAAAVIILYSAVSFSGLSFPDSCALNRLAGVYCPFCGGTRAIQKLLTGNFSEAFSMNQLVMILPSVAVGIAFSPFKKLKKTAPWIILGIILLYLILRNIPIEALNFLRPGL